MQEKRDAADTLYSAQLKNAYFPQKSCIFPSDMDFQIIFDQLDTVSIIVECGVNIVLSWFIIGPTQASNASNGAVLTRFEMY